MSITDELRAWIERYTMSGVRYRELLAIVDRIDAEHKAKVDEAYENGKRDERADWLDETDGGYIKLPVDADGVPIRVGDVVEYDGVSEKVTTLSLWSGGWNLDTEYGDFDGRRVKGYELELLDHPELFRHVKPDSWQRIIEDALHLQHGVHTLEYMQLVERCRRLAGVE